jgi:hypothetical protein
MWEEFLGMAVFAVVAVFLATRLYLLIVKGELQVRGVLYSRRRTPIWYWIIMFNASFGMMMAAVMAFAMAYFLAVGWDETESAEGAPLILVEPSAR